MLHLTSPYPFQNPKPSVVAGLGFWFLGLLCTLTACQRALKPNLERATQEILALEAQQRAYHFGEDARSFVDMFSKDFLSISRGKIEQPSAEASYEKFKGYFEAVEFVRWDDVKPPIIRFSKDASLAYVAVDKLVVVKLTYEDALETYDTTHFAWLSVYKREGATWKVDCVTSTRKD